MRPYWLFLCGLIVFLSSARGQTQATAAEISDMQRWAKPAFSGASDQRAERSGELNRGMPFSFRLGGVSSATFLASWKQAHTTRVLDSNRTLHTLTLSDGKSGIAVQCDAIVYSDYPTVDYVLYFENRGQSNSPILEEILPLDTRLAIPGGEMVKVHFSRGGGNSPQDYQWLHQTLESGKPFTLAAAGGRSSNTHMPWYNLQWPEGGLLAAIGWSGQWTASLDRAEGIRLKAGMEDGRFYLKPGEKIRTPRIVLTKWRGTDLARSYNLWRHVMFDHYMPRVDGKLVFPPIAKTTAYDELDTAAWVSTHGEANQLDIIRAASELGLEYYWLDAYWFHGYFPKGVGNWQFPVEKTVRDSFPRGLKPLADAAHKAGMKFILWFEPERVAPGTYVDREKSDWVIRAPGAKTYLYRLGQPEASEWMTRFIVETLKAFDVDVFRIDFNVDPLPFWRFADSEDRRGMTEIRHIENLYRMWDQIRASKPGIWIDNCASGGRRNDIETMSRSLPLWRSDYNDTPKRKQDEMGAIADQVMTMGLSLYMPLHAGPAWRPEPYYWRSAMSGGNNIYWDVRPNPKTGQYDYDRNLTRQGIVELKSLRPYYLGDYYPLTEMNANPDGWAAYQYVREKEGDGFAVFFRRPQTASPSLDVHLRGLEGQRNYRVTWYWNYEAAKTATVKGTELARFHAEIPEQPGSLLIRYQRQ